MTLPVFKNYYKRFIDDDHVLDLRQMKKNEGKNIQWFALAPNYGEESYGPILKKYKVIKSPRLIDLGKTKVRQKIIKKLKSLEPRIEYMINPDEQYSGGRGNKNLHEILEKYYSKKYDGTINVEEFADEENKGPTEVVLWHKHKKFLSQSHD